MFAFASILTCCLYDAGNEPAPLASAESYNPAKQRWECVAPMPTARCSSALLQTSSMLFVIGGVAQGPSNAVEALCLSDTVWVQHRESNRRNRGAPLHQTGKGPDVTDRPAEILFYLSTNMMYSSILMRRLHRWRLVNLKGLHLKSISTTRKRTFKCWAFCKKTPQKPQKSKTRKSRVLLWVLKEHRAILVNLCCVNHLINHFWLDWSQLCFFWF